MADCRDKSDIVTTFGATRPEMLVREGGEDRLRSHLFAHDKAASMSKEKVSKSKENVPRGWAKPTQSLGLLPPVAEASIRPLSGPDHATHIGLPVQNTIAAAESDSSEVLQDTGLDPREAAILRHLTTNRAYESLTGTEDMAITDAAVDEKVDALFAMVGYL